MLVTITRRISQRVNKVHSSNLKCCPLSTQTYSHPTPVTAHRPCLSATSKSPQTSFDKNHAYFLLELYKRKPELVMSHGSGCYLFDTQGNMTDQGFILGKKYLDLTAGIAVVALGHSHPIVAKAASEQVQELIHTSNLYHNKYAGKLAATLSHLMENEPCDINNMFKVFLCNSGTEANEAAIKFSRRYASFKLGPDAHNSKMGFVTFKNAFHGRTMGALSGTPNNNYQQPFLPLLPGFDHIPLGDYEAADKAINENTCGVLIEPIQGEGGIIPVPEPFMQFLREKTRKVDALLIFDEIQCGLGRTGKMYAHHHFNHIRPDIMTLAKPLANGIPIGATLVAPHVASTLKPGDHGTTFGGNPFASRVALSVLDEISHPHFLEHVQRVGDYFLQRLHEMKETSPLIVDIRGKGLMLGIQLRESVQPAMFTELALERGVLLVAAGNNTIRIVPPLIITNQQVDEAMMVLEDVVHTMEGLIATGKSIK